MRGPHGVAIIPASSGLQSHDRAHRRAARTSAARRSTEPAATSTYLLIDTAAGISDNVIDMLQLAERVVLVTSLEPSAIVDAYALTKVLTTADAAKEIGVVVNGAPDAEEAGLAFRQLDTATRALPRALRRLLRPHHRRPRACASRCSCSAPSSTICRSRRRAAATGSWRRGWPGSARRRAAFVWPRAPLRTRRRGDAMRMSAQAARLETRDELVMQNVALVKSLAQRLAQRLPSQVAGRGSRQRRRARPDRGGRPLQRRASACPFEAFARRRIHGAMLDALRDLDWAPRSLRRAAPRRGQRRRVGCARGSAASPRSRRSPRRWT